MSMTHKEMIEVIAAHEHGAQMQIRSCRRKDYKEWTNVCSPCWDFADYEYRVAPPAKVKMWQWLYKHGDGTVSITNSFYSDLRDVLRHICNEVIGPAKWTEIEVDAQCAERN